MIHTGQVGSNLDSTSQVSSSMPYEATKEIGYGHYEGWGGRLTLLVVSKRKLNTYPPSGNEDYRSGINDVFCAKYL